MREIAQRFDTSVSRLVAINNIADPNLIFPGQRLCVAAEDIIIPPTGQQATLSIGDVDFNDDITVRGQGFPANGRFNVLIGSADDDARRTGVRVDSFSVSAEGTFSRTFDLPARFQGEQDLAFRFEQTTTDFFVFAEFQNAEDAELDQIPVEDSLNLPATPAARTSTALSRGKRVTLAQGNAGVFIPNSALSGTLIIERFDPRFAQTEQLEFAQQLLRVRVTGGGGGVEDARGLIQVFFEIKAETREDFDVDRLTIYRFDPDDNAWEPCDIPVPVADGGLERLSCAIREFGLYGIAVRR